VQVIETPFPGACASMHTWSDDPSEHDENNELVVNCTKSNNFVARRTAPPPYVPVIETPFPRACASMNKWSDDPSEHDENNELVVNCIKDNNFMLNCGINWDRVSPDGEIGRSLRTFQQFRTDDITADVHMIFPPTSVKFVNNMHRKYIKTLVTNFRKGLNFADSLNTNTDPTPVQDCLFLMNCGVNWRAVDPSGDAGRMITQVRTITTRHPHFSPQTLESINTKYAFLVNILSEWLQRNLHCLLELGSFSARFYRKPEPQNSGNHMLDLIHKFWNMNKIVQNPINKDSFLDGITRPISNQIAKNMFMSERKPNEPALFESRFPSNGAAGCHHEIKWGVPRRDI